MKRIALFLAFVVLVLGLFQFTKGFNEHGVFTVAIGLSLFLILLKEKRFEVVQMRKEIQWLLFESGITSYKIAKVTGISQYTLGKYKKGKSDIGNMSLDNAELLHECYLKIKKEEI